MEEKIKNKLSKKDIPSSFNNDIAINEFKDDLQRLPADLVISKWVLENVPFIFHEDRQHYLEIKSKLSKQLNVDSCSILFVGSSSVGFSLNPIKNFKKFDKDSDIDIAVISHYYFDVAWRTIRDIDYSHQPIQVQKVLDEHRNRLIYWGTIATDKILGLLPFGAKWLNAIETLKSDQLFEDRKISFTLYQDHESLRLYHMNNFSSNLQNTIGVKPLITQL